VFSKKRVSKEADTQIEQVGKDTDMNGNFLETSSSEATTTGAETTPLSDHDAANGDLDSVDVESVQPSNETAATLDRSDFKPGVISTQVSAPEMSIGDDELPEAGELEIDLTTSSGADKPENSVYAPILWPGDLQGKMPPPLPFIPQPRVSKASSEIVDWPDTIIDSYVVASVGKATCISLRGDGKRYFGTSRQDSCVVAAVPSGRANSLVHLLAVADGVGSADLSHIASKLACRVALEELSVPSNLDGNWQETSAAVFRRVAVAIHSYAADAEIDPVRLLTTLRLAKVVPDASPGGGAHVFVASVGDGLTEHLGTDGVAIADNDVAVNGDEEALSPSTKALPRHADFFDAREFDLMSGEAVVLATDGAQAVWNSGHSIGSLVVRSDSTPMEIAWALDVRAQSHMDDRTVAFWRQG